MAKQAIAEAAAKIMHHQCLQDYGLAKQKALDSLGLPGNTPLPENQLINRALQAHLALFASDADKHWAEQLEDAAQQASHFLAPFVHYIGGSLASQTAKQEDRLEILLYVDCTEELLWRLQEYNIPYREQERVVRTSRKQEGSYPCFSFVANNIAVSITVFPNSKPRLRPCDIDGTPLPWRKPKP